MAITTLNTATELYKQTVDWYWHVNELPDEEFQSLVIKLNDDLNDDDFYVRELIEIQLIIVKSNRGKKTV